MASPLDRFKQTYFEECAELLEVLYANLGVLNEGRPDEETLHAIFRAVHSIKGGGGTFGYERLVEFAHTFETLLDLLRERKIAASSEVLATLMKASDILADMIETVRLDREIADGFGDDIAALLASLAKNDSNIDKPAELAVPSPLVQSIRHFRIRFVPHAEMFLRANEPLLLIRQLKRMGRVGVEPDLSRLPLLADLDPEAAYISWIITLETVRDRDDIAEIFEFVIDDCELEIDAIEIVPDIVVAETTGTILDLSAPLSEHEQSPSGSALHKPETAARGEPVKSIRVDIDKVDKLINLVGELIINQSMLFELGGAVPTDMSPGLLPRLETLSQHLRELQDSVMAIRAQPVKSVFARMPRLVREVSAQLDKNVRLVMTGESTEIDKTVIEQLADPLTHLLRNALDHGIESPEQRLAAGKSRQGTVQLSAEHRGGRIVIELTDDGRGINRERVLQKARERGLVAQDEMLSDGEIDQLIFMPSFSTAETVSNISGRGVGMDVVKRNIEALGGRIAVESQWGRGSRFSLSLPLTLAVLDGMVVAVGGETYVIPLTHIIESLRPPRADVQSLVGRGEVLALRGDYVPLVYLHRYFDAKGAIDEAWRGIVVMVEADGNMRVGLVVDEILGQQQVVVKSLETNYDAVEGIGGATILGNGRVAFIIDVAQISGYGAGNPPLQRRLLA